MTDYSPEQLTTQLDSITPGDIKIDNSAVEYITTHSVKGMNMAQASDGMYIYHRFRICPMLEAIMMSSSYFARQVSLGVSSPPCRPM